MARKSKNTAKARSASPKHEDITTDASEIVQQQTPIDSKQLKESNLEEQKKAEEETGKEKDEEGFDVLTELLCTDKILQVMIFFATVHLFYIQNKDQQYLYNAAQNALISFAVVFFVYYKKQRLDMTVENFTRNYFNVIYLVLFPACITFYYLNPSMKYLGVNCALLMNYLPVPTHLKLPLQGIFTLINGDNEYSFPNRFLYLGSIGLNYCIYFVLTRVSKLKSLSVIECNLFSILLTNVMFLYQSTSIHFQILQKSLWTLTILFTCNWLIDVFLFKYQGTARIFFLNISTFTAFPYLLQTLLKKYPTEHNVFNGNPLVWLMKYIQNDELRVKILSCWLTTLIVLIPTIFTLRSFISLNTSRKLWHGAVLLMIAIPFKYDAEFVKLSVSGIIPLFLLVEYLRYNNVLGSYINSTLKSFADYRDSAGPIIVSYLYLIIGVSFPLLLNNDISGCIVLGVGDAMASIVGKKMGRNFWDGPDRKTMEGTVAFIFTTFVVSVVFKAFYNDWDYLPILNNNEYLFELFANTLVAGVLEGNADFNDNILLPAYMLVFSKVLKV